MDASDHLSPGDLFEVINSNAPAPTFFSHECSSDGYHLAGTLFKNGDVLMFVGYTVSMTSSPDTKNGVFLTPAGVLMAACHSKSGKFVWWLAHEYMQKVT